MSNAKLLSRAFYVYTPVSSTSQTAAVGCAYILTNAAVTTVTAPTSPADNAMFGVIPTNGQVNLVDFGAQTVQGSSGNTTGLLSLDSKVPIYFVYVASLSKWVII